jgi:hypothetical protein
MPNSPLHLPIPTHFVSDTAFSAGFAGAVGVAFSWTIGGVNVVGIAITASVFLANFAWTVYRHFESDRQRVAADLKARAEVERRVKEAEERGYLRAKLDAITGETPGDKLAKMRDDFHSRATQRLDE